MEPNDILVGKGEWQCPFCRFHRKFSTSQGCLDGAAKHLLGHGKRLTLGRSTEPVNRTHGSVLLNMLQFFPRKERQ